MGCQQLNFALLIGDMRRARKESQSLFWRRFGVTQSGGSRYESGNPIPKPTALLIAAWVQGEIEDETLNFLHSILGACPAQV